MEEQTIITLTFGDVAENHVGMEQIGNLVNEGCGFQHKDLLRIKKKLKKLNIESRIIDLNNDYIDEEVCVLVISNGVNGLLNGEYTQDLLFEEQRLLNVDKKALMYGRVVNKHARWNLCFDDVGKEPDYENGKGRVISYDDVPITKKLYECIENIFGKKARGLKCEGNYYYDRVKCGIGYHGDSERRKVIGTRLGKGESLPLCFQWYIHNEKVGDKIEIPLNSGDMYVMSEYAVGTNWKRKNIYTIRHATGINYT